MIVFLIGLPWVALILATFLDERSEVHGSNSGAILLGAVLVLILVTIGFWMGKQ